jgi:hypothetical protein
VLIAAVLGLIVGVIAAFGYNFFATLRDDEEVVATGSSEAEPGGGTA